MTTGYGEAKTQQFRDFKGLNQTDARTAIDDLEFYWLENAMPIGKGQVTLVPGPGPSIVTISAGIVTMKGYVLNGNPVVITVNNDGSMTQVAIPGGGTTAIAAAGTVTAGARTAMWQDTTVLILDPTKGYFSWDGATLVSIDPTKLGTAIAVFEGRAWLANKRTLTFTSPNTFNDFTPGNGSGSSTISDAAFPGRVTELLSALEQLWIVGPGAVNVITNVATVSGITTSSNTNVVTNVGSTFPNSVVSFFRTLLFLTPYGEYAIVGATPQKLSDKLDNLFPLLIFGADQPVAVGTVYNIFVVAALVTSADGIGGTGSNRPLLLCFASGKWFLAAPSTTLTWITSVLVSGQPQMWGTNGTNLYRLFSDPKVAVAYTIKTKLWDFGDATQRKELLRVGLEFFSLNVVSPTVFAENESGQASQVTLAIPQNVITFRNNALANLSWTGAGGATVTWVAGGLQLVRSSTLSLLGRYLGLTLKGTAKAFTLSAIDLDVKLGGRWN